MTRSYLGRHIMSGPTTDEDMEAMRGRAWRQNGIAMIAVDEVSNEWVRAWIEAEMTARHGSRRGQRHG